MLLSSVCCCWCVLAGVCRCLIVFGVFVVVVVCVFFLLVVFGVVG